MRVGHVFLPGPAARRGSESPRLLNQTFRPSYKQKKRTAFAAVLPAHRRKFHL
jgi:hypothetical protein